MTMALEVALFLEREGESRGQVRSRRITHQVPFRFPLHFPRTLDSTEGLPGVANPTSAVTITACFTDRPLAALTWGSSE